jgi:transposase
MAVAPWIVSDELWHLVEPVLPKSERRFLPSGPQAIARPSLRTAGELEWSRGDRRLQPGAGEKGGSATGPSPVDRGRPGSKHDLLVDATGIPLAFSVTGGNRNDVTELIPLLDSVPAVRGAVGRPRRRPDSVIADRGYDHDKCRRLAWERGVKPVIARRQTEHGSGLGCYRWVVERTVASFQARSPPSA